MQVFKFYEGLRVILIRCQAVISFFMKLETELLCKHNFCFVWGGCSMDSEKMYIKHTDVMSVSSFIFRRLGSGQTS